MTIRSVIALTVVCGSACIALETQLASERQAVVVVSDNPYVFTTPNQPHMFTVTAQSSTDNDTVTAIRFDNPSACQNFRIEPVTLPATVCGGSAASGCPKTVPFAVTYLGTGVESCDVAVVSMSSGSGSGGINPIVEVTEYLRLSSNVSTPSVLVVPESIEFGQVGVNIPSTSQIVRVSNTGSVALLVNATTLGAIPTAFTVEPAALLVPHMLTVGSYDDFRISCKPPAAGMHSAALRVNASGIIKTSNFTCEGVTSGIAVDPSPVVFPPTLIGKAAAPQSIRISSSSAILARIDLDATARANNVSFKQPPPSNVSAAIVELNYAPDQRHDSGPLGKLVITPSIGLQREVNINGQALPGSIGTNPASVDFGPVCVGRAAVRDIEVFANAAGSVQLQSPDAPGLPFSLAPLGYPATLQGNHVGSTTLKVGVTPNVTGEVSATLHLPTDIPNSQPYPLSLSATAVPRATISATPQMVQFGMVGKNTSTSGREVTLSNCGADKLTITGATIIGADPGEFAIVAPNNPAVTLQTAEHLTFLVIMSAHDVLGEKAALLHIEHSAGTTDVQLAGAVGAGASGNSKDRETYYGCQVVTGSSSAASSAVVVAMSWLAARRRRRRR